MPTPELDDEPYLEEALYPVYKAFWFLSNRRAYGGGMVPIPSPIPLGAMRDYLALYGPWTPLERRSFVEVIDQLDAAYIEYQVKQSNGDIEGQEGREDNSER